MFHFHVDPDAPVSCLRFGKLCGNARILLEITHTDRVEDVEMTEISRKFVGFCTWCSLGALSALAVVSAGTLLWVWTL